MMRDAFPMLKRTCFNKPFIYLDTAATSQKPQCVIDAVSDFYSKHYGTVHRAVYSTAVEATELYAESRRTAQKFLNAKREEEIIFTRGTTDGINLVASSFGRAFINKGDEIIITEMEHHSNIVPWQMVACERGAILKVVPFFDDGHLDLNAFHNMLSDRTKIVAVTHLSNVLGTVNPIQEIVKAAHAHGAKVLVDGAQSAPHLQVDVQALGVDFFVFSGHKVYGPTGVGVLYGKYELLDQMPPYQGGGDMIEEVRFENTTYNTLPLKFEAGTPMIAEVIGLGRALAFLMDIGLQNIAAYEAELLDYLWENLSLIPKIKILGSNKHRGSLISFYVEGVHPLDIATLLDLQGIACRSGHLCAQPVMRHYKINGACRVSFSFYNTKNELKTFCEVLVKAIDKLV